MKRKRLIPHLVKCRLSHPDVELMKCPFNASHLIPEPEFTHHVTNCSDRAIIDRYKYNTLPVKQDFQDRQKIEIECDENWDDTEADDYDPTKHVTKKNVILNHIGGRPSDKKEFRKNERKRLGDAFSSDEEEAGKTSSKKVYKDMDCKVKEEATENKWYEDRGASSSDTRSRTDLQSYESTLKEYSKERGRGEDYRRKLVKVEKDERKEEEEHEHDSRGHRNEEYSLDDDPYYRTNDRKPLYLGMGRGARRGYSYRK